MQGRTYRYFGGEPLYPFGFGLSFTQFQYGKLKFAPRIAAGGSLAVTAEVQNSGKLAGDEVVQLYIKNTSSPVAVPNRSLAGVRHLFLKPGERRVVTFSIDPRQMSVILDNGKRSIEPGDFEISVGGKQPGFKGSADASTTGVVIGRFSVTGKAKEIRER
jgi:beta-glucosidase